MPGDLSLEKHKDEQIKAARKAIEIFEENFHHQFDYRGPQSSGEMTFTLDPEDKIRLQKKLALHSSLKDLNTPEQKQKFLEANHANHLMHLNASLLFEQNNRFHLQEGEFQTTVKNLREQLEEKSRLATEQQQKAMKDAISSSTQPTLGSEPNQDPSSDQNQSPPSSSDQNQLVSSSGVSKNLTVNEVSNYASSQSQQADASSQSQESNASLQLHKPDVSAKLKTKLALNREAPLPASKKLEFAEMVKQAHSNLQSHPIGKKHK